jgi:threonine/homoserine/homoserine lactone efflux protein
MLFISHFLIGFIISFIGTIPPSTFNLLAIRRATSTGLRKAMIFACGVVFVEFFYCFIAVIFSGYFLANKTIGSVIEIIAVPIFILLAYMFLTKKHVEPTQNEKEPKGSGDFVQGLFIGLMNPTQITFWLGYSTYFISIGWMKDDLLLMTTFVVGVCAGSLAMLFIYAYYCKKWFYGNAPSLFSEKILNKIVGFIFVGLAVLQTGKLLWEYWYN